MKNHLIWCLALLFVIISTENKETNTSSRVSQWFTFAVIADPQAWRTENGSNPNDYNTNGDLWEFMNSLVVKSLNSIRPILDFGIVNGDITEFGRWKMWVSFEKLYSLVKFPLFVGLGNHDYQNNVRDCWLPKRFLSSDQCAILSTSLMERMQSRYSSLPNYRVDWKDRYFFFWPSLGSLSYSWDWKNVHFVQLQNYPTYSEKLIFAKILFIFKLVYFDFSRSLTWLADDLNMARKRGITDIIINFHQYDGILQKSDGHDQMYFQAIMETYTPLAIFVGHRHRFQNFTNCEYSGNTTTFFTGAAFKGRFHVVKYNNSELTVSAMDGKKGLLNEYKKRRQRHKPTCIVGYGNRAKPGYIFTSSFIPEEGTAWNIYHRKHSRRFLKATIIWFFTFIKTVAFAPDDTDARWRFKKMELDKNLPEFWAHYYIIHENSNKALACLEGGFIVLKEISKFDESTHWRIIKTEQNGMMLLNRATNLFLYATYDGLLSGVYGYDAENTYKSWEIFKSWDKTDQRQNIRYFEAIHKNSGAFPIPTGNISNKYWKFLGYHNYLKPSPCVGW